MSSRTKTNPNGQSPHVYPQGANDGELPLAVFYPEGRDVTGIAIVEGTRAKPFFVAQRLGMLNQNKEKPNTEAWDIWRKARLFSPNLTINTKYFDTGIPEVGTFLAIKSGTGTGKTHWLINDLIQAYSDCGFLSVGYRNSPLIQFSLDEKLKKNWYHLQKDLRNTKELILIADPLSKILCCLDSLIHFKPQDFQNKILILDEIESIISHLFKANTTISLFREKVKELFIEALNRSSMIIIMDGHLNDTTIEYLQGLISNPKKLVKIENIYQGNKGHVNFLEGIESEGEIKINDYSPITEAIKNNLDYFAVASDSQCQLDVTNVTPPTAVPEPSPIVGTLAAGAVLMVMGLKKSKRQKAFQAA